MNQRQMFEASFGRPSNYLELDPSVQWAIDKSLGILDWEAQNLSEDDMKRLRAHYGLKD